MSCPRLPPPFALVLQRPPIFQPWATRTSILLRRLLQKASFTYYINTSISYNVGRTLISKSTTGRTGRSSSGMDDAPGGQVPAGVYGPASQVRLLYPGADARAGL